MKNMNTLICLLVALLMALLPLTALAEEAIQPEATAVVEAVEEPNEEESLLSEMFGDLAGMRWYTAAILVVLAGVGLVLCTGKKNWTTRRIAYAAMCIAISFVLSCIKLFHMPQGGSVTPAAMLPLILFALACGPVQGLVVGCAYGLLQLVEDPYVIHPIQLLTDYPLAYGVMIAACLALLLPEKAKRFRLPLAVILGYLARWAMAVLSGVVFFAEYAGDQNVLIYSMGYNIAYLAPEMLIAVVIAFIPGWDRLIQMIRGRRT